MKAIICTKYGSPDVLQLQDVAKPAPKDDEVLINIVIEPWLMLSAVSGKWRTQHRLRNAAPLL